MVRAKNPESFEKIHTGDFEIFCISYVTPVPNTDCVIPIVGVNIQYSFTLNHLDRVFILYLVGFQACTLYKHEDCLLQMAMAIATPDLWFLPNFGTSLPFYHYQILLLCDIAHYVQVAIY